MTKTLITLLIITITIISLGIGYSFGKKEITKKQTNEADSWQPATTTIQIMNLIPRDILQKICKEKGGTPRISESLGLVCDVFGDDIYIWSWEVNNFVTTGIIELK